MHDLDKLQKLRSLRDAALSCLALSKPEPSWGEEVFRPLLGLAAELENRNNEQKVQVENVYVLSGDLPSVMVKYGVALCC